MSWQAKMSQMTWVIRLADSSSSGDGTMAGESQDIGESRADAEREWWMDFPRSWRDVVLVVAVLATFVALCFAPAASCSITSTPNEPTTNTTEADHGR